MQNIWLNTFCKFIEDYELWIAKLLWIPLELYYEDNKPKILLNYDTLIRFKSLENNLVTCNIIIQLNLFKKIIHQNA